jgi:hypothetical protein
MGRRSVAYLRALGDSWRLEASGFRELTVHLTEEARAHGLAAVVPARFTASVGYGRGERSSADTLRVIVRNGCGMATRRRAVG